MKTRLLTAEEYKATFSEPMRDVLDTATNVIDVWPYVAAVPTIQMLGHTARIGFVEHAYRTGDDTFDHVLIPTDTKNVFLAVIVNLIHEIILGHHLLDLNSEYDLVIKQ